jgi:hypothetical protein
MSTYVRPAETSEVAAYGVYIAGMLRGYVARRDDRWVAFDADYRIIEGPVLKHRAAAIQRVRQR